MKRARRSDLSGRPTRRSVGAGAAAARRRRPRRARSARPPADVWRGRRFDSSNPAPTPGRRTRSTRSPSPAASAHVAAERLAEKPRRDRDEGAHQRREAPEEDRGRAVPVNQRSARWSLSGPRCTSCPWRSSVSTPIDARSATRRRCPGRYPSVPATARTSRSEVPRPADDRTASVSRRGSGGDRAGDDHDQLAADRQQRVDRHQNEDGADSVVDDRVGQRLGDPGRRRHEPHVVIDHLNGT